MKELSSALRNTLLTYILLVYTLFILAALPRNPNCQAKEEKSEIYLIFLLDYFFHLSIF